MYIDQGNMIQNMKQAQHLENVKEKSSFTDRETTRAIRDAIIAEEGAINQYETIVDSTNNAKVKEILQEIADEEKVHVGELQTLLNGLLEDEKGFLEDGAKEVGDVGASDKSVVKSEPETESEAK